MSEEEKETLNYIKEHKNYIEKFCEALNDEGFDTDEERDALKKYNTLINLIEKQQKEIEELKKDKKALVNNYDNVLKNFISKDKIREKIKELERLNKEQEIPVLKEYKFIRKEMIDYFKKLIGEE